MAEINGYLLTKEEEKACIEFIKKMRERKTFTIDFSGCVRVKAKTSEEANDIFWEWIGDLQDKSLVDWSGVVTQSPYFERESSPYFENEDYTCDDDHEDEEHCFEPGRYFKSIFELNP